MQLWHHGLHLPAVQHAHQRRFYHVVVVVPQRYFVAAQLLRFFVQIPAPHARAQVAGRFFYFINRVKNARFKNSDGHTQQLRVLLDHAAVGFAVAGVHHQKHQLKREFIVPFQLLKQLCHQHRIFAA
ncbi:hypothetical protein SDC9_164703 [bioreactor metagenome]|uniref:Uncharacterized protein n=1 Tax=bioreactor metagenome TaxID=1076179 RepID=A0A645FU38_9ZZZZ